MVPGSIVTSLKIKTKQGFYAALKKKKAKSILKKFFKTQSLVAMSRKLWSYNFFSSKHVVGIFQKALNRVSTVTSF